MQSKKKGGHILRKACQSFRVQVSAKSLSVVSGFTAEGKTCIDSQETCWDLLTSSTITKCARSEAREGRDLELVRFQQILRPWALYCSSFFSCHLSLLKQEYREQLPV